MKGRAVLLGVVAALALTFALVLSAFGLQLPFALGWAVLVVAGFAMPLLMNANDAPRWPPPDDHAVRGASEVSRLAWDLRMRDGTVGTAARRRVRAIARHRLARAGVDLDDPAHAAAVDAALGPGMHDALTAQRVTLAELDAILDAIESVAPRTLEEEVSDDRGR